MRLKQYILMNGSKVFEQYGLEMIPTVLFINKEGVIEDVEVGFSGPEHLKEKTLALLGKTTPSTD